MSEESMERWRSKICGEIDADIERYEKGQKRKWRNYAKINNRIIARLKKEEEIFLLAVSMGLSWLRLQRISRCPFCHNWAEKYASFKYQEWSSNHDGRPIYEVRYVFKKYSCQQCGKLLLTDYYFGNRYPEFRELRHLSQKNDRDIKTIKILMHMDGKILKEGCLLHNDEGRGYKTVI